jgi:hypothetical protein
MSVHSMEDVRPLQSQQDYRNSVSDTLSPYLSIVIIFARFDLVNFI